MKQSMVWSSLIWGALALGSFQGVNAHGHSHESHTLENAHVLAPVVSVEGARSLVDKIEWTVDAVKSELKDEVSTVDLSDIITSSGLDSSFVTSLFKSVFVEEEHAHIPSSTGVIVDFLLGSVFVFGPLGNAFVAVAIMTIFTNAIIQFSPELGGASLSFLVAFAEGGMLGNVFVHLAPEVYEHYSLSSALVLLAGFLFFCGVDKWLRILAIGVDGNAQTHTHSHQRESSPAVRSQTSGVSSGTESSELKSRKKTLIEEHEAKIDVDDHHVDAKDSESSRSVTVAILNVAADFLHNITDGIALAAAFSDGTPKGALAFVLMVLHEVPHQFGDFALLIQSGISKNAGIKAQLITALGTFLGCALFGAMQKANQDAIENIIELITPFTAGVFLFLSTVGILPEILEVDPSLTKRELATQSFFQILGIGAGLSAMILMS